MLTLTCLHAVVLIGCTAPRHVVPPNPLQLHSSTLEDVRRVMGVECEYQPGPEPGDAHLFYCAKAGTLPQQAPCKPQCREWAFHFRDLRLVGSEVEE